MPSWQKSKLFGLVMFLAIPARAVDVNTNSAPPADVRALPRSLRVDLAWDQSATPVSGYEVQRAPAAEGPFATLPIQFANPVPIYSDYLGEAKHEYFYRVRNVYGTNGGQPSLVSRWSPVCHATPGPLKEDQLLTEVQEAGFRYFYDYGHPVSGLAREWTTQSPDVCAPGGTGFGMFNFMVGVERGFITREQAMERALRILHFLSDKAKRFHGAFPHWVDGNTGNVVPFSAHDNGADIVETSFLMEGVLAWREFFTGNNEQEAEIRRLCDALWRAVEWDWFAREQDGVRCLEWHWSPDYGWKPRDCVSGFNECQIAYVLGLASPTHPIRADYYWQGWEVAGYGNPRLELGVQLELSGNYGPPLFWIEYSYLGLDPRQISYDEKTYFELFQNFCRVERRYAQSRKNDFKGYGEFWGWSAGYGPGGYEVFTPGKQDNGTINPGATLAAMPYAPEACQKFLLELYLTHGRELWGPFGFCDGFNLTAGWNSHGNICNNVGPIGPMIENYRSGLCWKTFMKAPEMAAVLRVLNKHKSQ